MALDLPRGLRHLFAGSAATLYPEASLQRIASAIAEGEATHRGQVVFAVEPALPFLAALTGRSARHRAHEVFAQLRVWDTEANTGVLIYLLVADHRIEILADRGLAAQVDAAQWSGICHAMETRLKAGEPEAAALDAVQAVSALLAAHHPRRPGDRDSDELPNRPHVFS